MKCRIKKWKGPWSNCW